MEFTLDYASLAKTLEAQELDSPTGRASPQVYGQLLAIYLLFNDLTSAKFLWKRIPPEIKSANDELSIIWLVGKLMWKRNYKEIYSAINSCPSWPKHLKNIMSLIAESTRERAINLVTKAYSTIKVADAASLIGLPEDELLKLAEKLKWTHDKQSGYLNITKSDQNQTRTNRTDKNGTPLVLDNGSELLEKLTDYILFLERSTIKS